MNLGRRAERSADTGQSYHERLPVAPRFLRLISPLIPAGTLAWWAWEGFRPFMGGEGRWPLAELLTLLAVALPFLLVTFARLSVQVSGTDLRVSFNVLPMSVTLPLTRLREARAETWDPLPDFGGWGYRSGRGGVGFIADSGGQGVRLTDDRGHIFSVSTRSPAALLEALRQP